MGKQENFTADRVAVFRCESGKQQTIYWDGKAPGLGVRVTAAGAKSYIFEARIHGKTMRQTIGSPDSWPLETQWRKNKETGEREQYREGAREKAASLKALTDQGIDPREQAQERKEASEAKRAARKAAENMQHFSLRALLDAYVRMLEAKGKTKSAGAAKSLFKCHVHSDAEISDTPAKVVTAHQIAALVRKAQEAGKRRTAGVLRAYILAAYNAAKKAPFDATMPADLIPFNIEANPADPIPAIPVVAGTRALSAGELKAYIAHLGDDMADVSLRVALLAGGQRIAQLLRARVSDYDADTQTLRLFDPKGKRKQPREHLLPLAPKAAAIVEKLIVRAKKIEKKAAEKESRDPVYTDLWLFSSHGRTQLVDTTAGKRLADISTDMKGEPFTLRDIRRTCETMLAGMGISRDTRAQLLSHGISGVQSVHYDLHSYTDEKRAALAAWEERIAEIEAGKKKAGNVVKLRARGKAAA
jgi:integrase